MNIINSKFRFLFDVLKYRLNNNINYFLRDQTLNKNRVKIFEEMVQKNTVKE